MAKISFYLPEGEELTVKLIPHQTLHVGRDPGNDLVLRDPKVSRRHAEIVFEKGFFVVHDLESANGTFINGKRIRVAPLANGAEIKLGNSYGRFSEEISDADDGPGATAAHDRGDFPDSPVDQKKRTAEVELRLAPSGQLRVARPEAAAAPQLTPVARFEPAFASAEPNATPDLRFTRSKYLIDRGEAIDDRISIRDTDQRPFFWFLRNVDLTAFAANLVGGIVAISGIAVIVLLLVSGRIIPSLIAAGLTFAFTLLIASMIPLREIQIFGDEAMKQPLLVVQQRARFPFPETRYVASDANGNIVGFLKKNDASFIGRSVWTFFDSTGRVTLAEAREQRFFLSITRKWLGGFSAIPRTDYAITVAGKISGRLLRPRRTQRDLLDLSDDRWKVVDRRLALALLGILYAVERG
jgi:FHA domain